LVLNIIYDSLYLIFPAYCANSVPVLLGGGPAIDGGRRFFDGKPILGPGKTIRGFLSGIAVGTLIGLIQGQILLGFLLSLGALVGDLLESFIKRRLDIASGASFPVADQLDFVFGALLFSLPVFSIPLHIVLTILLITPPLHLFTNLLAYLLGFKKEPW
jgi:CDP-2,3-bis-(O-geranylgeranyl)-sn-glycerol synthase